MWNFNYTTSKYDGEDDTKWRRTTGKLFNLCSEYNEYISNPEKYANRNFYLIRDEVNENLGKFIDIYGHKGILVGAVLDDDDYYYLVLDETRKVIFHSCCGGFKEVQREDLSMNFSVLLWLRDNEPESLLQIVIKCIESNYVVPITSISVV